MTETEKAAGKTTPPMEAANGKTRENDPIVIPRPDWWCPGLPLPAVQARTTYTGKGRIGAGGKVITTVTPVRWETIEERDCRLIVGG